MNIDKIKIYLTFIMLMVLAIVLLPFADKSLKKPAENTASFDRAPYSAMMDTVSRFKASNPDTVLGGMIPSDFKYKALKVEEFKDLKGVDHPFGR